jgi:RNA-directed DNA polymerase
MEKIKLNYNYHDIISPENLFEAWQDFVRGKRRKKDVQEFELHLMDNIFSLHEELVTKTYKHSNYKAFNISDPKPRNIHKAKVRDRLLHHAIYRILYPFFDTTFIADSYSCRKQKGTHLALKHFRTLAYRASSNHTKTLWVLKCDIRKFFASIDQNTLIAILRERVIDQDILWLLQVVIQSFASAEKSTVALDLSSYDKRGLPLGNLTSQLLVNIYMNEFDQFMKHRVKAKYYIRYADDFVIFSQDRNWLRVVLLQLNAFLNLRLHLSLHPNKVSMETLSSGVDFLGWVHFSDHQVLRTVTKKRMFKNVRVKKGSEATIQSYRGLLKHGNGRTLQAEVLNLASAK